MNQTTVAARLRKAVNWDYFFTLVHTLGNSLDGPKYRFIKSDLLELAIEVFAGNAIKWVNGEGCDHILDNTIRIEMKHHKKSLYTAGGRPKKYVGPVRMQNTLGGGETRTLHDTFDYLLITDQNSAAVVSHQIVRRSTRATSDAIVIASKHLPLEEVSFIVRPEDIRAKSIALEPVLEALHSRYRAYLAEVQRQYDNVT